MVDISPQRRATTFGARPPMGEFVTVAVVLAIGLTGVSAVVLATPIWSLGAFGICVVLASIGVRLSYPHALFGLCNMVTMARAALLSLLVGVLFDVAQVSSWLVFWTALVILVLDGVDGWLARRSHLKSAFGARFDMETDAALGAVLALYLLVSSTTGVEILVLGFMRYAFVLAGFFWPVLRRDLPESFRRKAICVVQIATLIALIFPLFPDALTATVALGASMLLVFSFIVDTAWLVWRSK